MSAILSPCGIYRYRLERDVAAEGFVFAYIGVNSSTATATVNDHTVAKWIGFTRVNQGRRFIVGNAFAYRAADVGALARASDPIGPENDAYLDQIILDADIIVPCWGSRTKLPKRLYGRLDHVRDRLLAAGKPIWVLGFCKSGDPCHPLMLPYDTPLIRWQLVHGA